MDGCREAAVSPVGSGNGKTPGKPPANDDPSATEEANATSGTTWLVIALADLLQNKLTLIAKHCRSNIKIIHTSISIRETFLRGKISQSCGILAAINWNPEILQEGLRLPCHQAASREVSPTYAQNQTSLAL